MRTLFMSYDHLSSLHGFGGRRPVRARRSSRPRAQGAGALCAQVGDHLVRPEQRLYFAVLADAIRILRGGAAPDSGCDPDILEETVTWVLSDDVRWSYSFRNVCEALDMDPDRQRRRLLRWLSPRAREGLRVIP